MRLLRILEPFDHPDFLYEVKFDGFRSVAHVNGHHCQLISMPAVAPNATAPTRAGAMVAAEVMGAFDGKDNPVTGKNAERQTVNNVIVADKQ